MKTMIKCLAGAAAIAALASAAPAAAQFFPGYGYPAPGYGSGAIIGSIVNSVAGGGYGGYGGYSGYGYNVPGGGRVAASQCTAAVQQRLGGYAGYGYGVNGRVLGINSVEIRGNGGYTVRGTASGATLGPAPVGFTCRTDPRGLVMRVAFNGNYGNGYYGNAYAQQPYPGYSAPAYDNPYAVYGYSRY